MLTRRLKYFFLLQLLIFHISAKCDNFITNGGFEGPDGIEMIPPDWFAGCGVMNTPDTQPGWWNVENEPHEGKSYLDLLYKEDGTTESVYQELATPLPKGSCFLIEIWLAQACQDSLSGLYHYNLNNPGDLIIRGSDSYGCDNGQILAEFKQVNNCEWKQFYAVFKAEFEIRYIYLEFKKGISPHLDGSILIDDFTLDFTQPLPLHELSIEYGMNAEISATLEGTTFNWIINKTTLYDDSSFQVITVTENYTIEVNYLSTDSCLVFENWVIYVKPIIPNGFTPLNPDGVNDYFEIKGLVEKAHLTVLNRWGYKVYENTNYQNDWSPHAISSGVYFYHLQLYETGRVFMGFVTIF